MSADTTQGRQPGNVRFGWESGSTPTLMSEGHPRGNGDGPLTPTRSEATTGAEASMPTPPCPACGQPATQAHVRDTLEHVHEGTYVCADGHIWTTKWFAIERSA